ncbi:hypothetical protein J5893_06060 [bacterium]|nr:hypothetical protein [bacterium]
MAKQNLSQHLASLGDLFMQTWEIIKKEWKNLLITSLFGVAIGFIGIILM